MDWDWDLVKPFSAAAVRPPVSDPVAVMSATVGTPTATESSPHTRGPSTWRVLRYLHPTPSLPLPDPNIPNNNTYESTMDVNDAGVLSGPCGVKVGVLIAMPTQSISRSLIQPHTSQLSSILESSPLGHPQSETPQSRDEETAEELPCLEFGIADLGVRLEEHGVDRGIESKRLESTRSSVASMI